MTSSLKTASSRALYDRGLIHRRTTMANPRSNFFDNSVFRLIYLQIVLFVYYAINVWYYNHKDDSQDMTGCDLLWCSPFQLKLYNVFTTMIMICNVFVAMFLVSNYKVYKNEYSFHTEFNTINRCTVIIFPFLYLSAIVLIIIFCVGYIISFSSNHSGANRKGTQTGIVLNEIAFCLNQVCILLCVSFDLFNLHHSIQKKQQSRSKVRSIALVLTLITERNLRITVFSIFLSIIAWLYAATTFLMKSNSDLDVKHEEDYNTYVDDYDHIKIVGFLLIAVVSLIIAIKYLFTYLLMQAYDSLVFGRMFVNTQSNPDKHDHNNSSFSHSHTNSNTNTNTEDSKGRGNDRYRERDRDVCIVDEMAMQGSNGSHVVTYGVLGQHRSRDHGNAARTPVDLNLNDSDNIVNESPIKYPSLRNIITPHENIRPSDNRSSSSELDGYLVIAKEDHRPKHFLFNRKQTALEMNIVHKLSLKLLIAIVFGFILISSLVLVWIGIIHDVQRDKISPAVELAVNIAPPLLYSSQVIFVSLDMALIFE